MSHQWLVVPLAKLLSSVAVSVCWLCHHITSVTRLSLSSVAVSVCWFCHQPKQWWVQMQLVSVGLTIGPYQWVLLSIGFAVLSNQWLVQLQPESVGSCWCITAIWILIAVFLLLKKIQLFCLCVETFAFWLVIYIKTFNKMNNKTQWNMQLKNAQIQGKYLTLSFQKYSFALYCDLFFLTCCSKDVTVEVLCNWRCQFKFAGGLYYIDFACFGHFDNCWHLLQLHPWLICVLQFLLLFLFFTCLCPFDIFNCIHLNLWFNCVLQFKKERN